MYTYKTVKESIQNKLLLSKVENLTNAGLIKSEVEYKRYLNSILSTLNKNNTQIFNAKDITIKYSDLISFKVYKENFEKIYYDLFTMYTEANNIKTFLINNLEKNKQFYKNIRERIRNYRKYLTLLKFNTYDITISSNSFMESFINADNNYYLDNCEINDKIDKLYLKPAKLDKFNNSLDIDRVEIEVIPSENEEGGVYFTHTKKNDITENYKSGKRNMLQDGLWKLQLLTEGIPETYITINGSQKKYFGISAIMDIYFTNMKPINRLFIEPYGEFYTNIICIQYKKDNEWKPLRIYNTKTGTYDPINGEKLIFDFMNIEPVSTNALRIIFHQENYKMIENYILNQTDALNTLIKEIQENRYDYLDKVTIKNKLLTKPFDVTDEKTTLLEQINDIIFETNTFDQMEIKIKELLFPALKNINYNSNWKIYELGAWKIIPQYVQYSDQPGTFVSHIDGGYSVSKAPLQIGLTVNDEHPKKTYIEYFITDEKETKFIPITPMGQNYRIEENRFKIMPEMYRSDHITDYYVWLFDFPVHKDYMKYIEIYINGRQLMLGSNWDTKLCFFNDRTMYIPGLKYNPNDKYAVKYYPAKNDIVECWQLKPNNTDLKVQPHNYNFNSYWGYETKDHVYHIVTDPGIFLDQEIIFPTKEKASEFLYLFDVYWISKLVGKKNMQISYSPIKTLCSLNNFNLWFNYGRRCTFIEVATTNVSATTAGSLSSTFPYRIIRKNIGNFNEWRYNINESYSYNVFYTKSSWIFFENNSYKELLTLKNGDGMGEWYPRLPPYLGGNYNEWFYTYTGYYGQQNTLYPGIMSITN